MKQITVLKKDVMTMLRNVNPGSIVKFEVLEVKESLQAIKSGKGPGLDESQGEHFKYADDTLYSCLLCMLFNTMVKHVYMPSKCMEAIIVPIVKDKKGLIIDKENCRLVLFTRVASKILKVPLLRNIHECLYTACNQFGFMPKYGTEMCVYIEADCGILYIKGRPRLCLLS